MAETIKQEEINKNRERNKSWVEFVTLFHLFEGEILREFFSRYRNSVSIGRIANVTREVSFDQFLTSEKEVWESYISGKKHSYCQGLLNFKSGDLDDNDRLMIVYYRAMFRVIAMCFDRETLIFKDAIKLSSDVVHHLLGKFEMVFDRGLKVGDSHFWDAMSKALRLRNIVIEYDDDDDCDYEEDEDDDCQ